MTKLEDLIKKIETISDKIGREVKIMEVCGTHTQAISKFRIREILPKNIKLITGPGCPVCVTAQKDVDEIIEIAKNGIPVATYGDMIKVPGNNGSLESVRQEGGKIYAVYSVDEVLELQKKYNNIVFFGLGFETTVPATLYGIEKGLNIYSSHKLFIPAMKKLIEMGEIKIDGFLNPGHVSVVTGTGVYEDIKVSQVIAGFELEDILVGIYLLLKQICENRKEVENSYPRAVKIEGNKKIYNKIFELFDVVDTEWRGFGVIKKSGLELKEKYSNQNAKLIYKGLLDKLVVKEDPRLKICQCDEVVRGLINPNECKMFRKVCSPENPIGPCMVSSEGACNVEFENK